MTDEIRQRIEAYLGGTLPAEEALLFEQEMKTNPVLLEEVELSRQINHYLKGDMEMGKLPENEYTQKLRAYLRSEEAEKVKASLQKAEQDYNNLKKPTKNKNYLLVAATIALLLISTVGYNFFGKQNPEKLYTQYYTTSDLPSVINRDEDASMFEVGVLAFNKNEYASALSSFENYIETENPIDYSVFLYSGIAHLEMNELENAIADFDRVTLSNSIDSSKGRWFKALAYLKVKETEKAKNVLTEIVKSSSNFNYNKAKELLEEL